MKIRILSDLHLEFFGSRWRAFVESLPTDCDVLVLAGDVCSPASGPPSLFDALSAFCDRFPHVVFVLGNHEYYRDDPPWLHTRIADAAHRIGRPSLSWLNRSSVTVNGQRFVGCSLWFPSVAGPSFALADFSMIHNFVPWVTNEAARDREFLSREVRPGDIVVTHHLPSERSVAPQFKGSPLNAYFVHDVESVMREREPALWVHGHTHSSCDYVAGKTRVVCNPYGYGAHDMNAEFDARKTVEVGLEPPPER
jgi:Icc-related predicted phosphoesterase